MLITLSVPLASLKTACLAAQPLVQPAACLRWFWHWLSGGTSFNPTGTLRGDLIQAAMPAAIFNYLGWRCVTSAVPAEVASLIVISTLLSFILSPALISLHSERRGNGLR